MSKRKNQVKQQTEQLSWHQLESSKMCNLKFFSPAFNAVGRDSSSLFGGKRRVILLFTLFLFAQGVVHP